MMSEVTYGQLDSALRGLGFSARIDEAKPRARVYEHESGAILMLPAFPDDQEVYPHHLSAAEITLDTYGIASRWDFVAELQKISGRV
jgi:hypothetical protein